MFNSRIHVGKSTKDIPEYVALSPRFNRGRSVARYRGIPMHENRIIGSVMAVRYVREASSRRREFSACFGSKIPAQFTMEFLLTAVDCISFTQALSSLEA
jgi:hypothetical protein